MNKVVNAYVWDRDVNTIKVNVPIVMNESKKNYQVVASGILRKGVYKTDNWGIVHDYSIYRKRDGSVHGDIYIAYDMTKESHVRKFNRVVEENLVQY